MKDSNYQVIKLLGGQWIARYLCQDGWEQEQYKTRSEAIKGVKAGFNYNNPGNAFGLPTTRISFGEEYVTSVIEVRWKEAR